MSFGLPVFNMVGLPDSSVRESRDRVRSVILNSGFEFSGTDSRSILPLPTFVSVAHRSTCRSRSGCLLRVVSCRAASTPTCCCSGSCPSTERSSRPAAFFRWRWWRVCTGCVFWRHPTRLQRQPWSRDWIPVSSDHLPRWSPCLSGESLPNQPPSSLRSPGPQATDPIRICATSAASVLDVAPWRSPPPDATTSSSLARRTPQHPLRWPAGRRKDDDGSPAAWTSAAAQL